MIRWSRPPTTCPRAEKMDALRLLLEFHQPALSIIFCNTKSMVEQLGEYLNNAGIGCEVLHGDMKKSARTQVMDRLKSRRGLHPHRHRRGRPRHRRRRCGRCIQL